MKISRCIRDRFEELVRIRRDLHRIPEEAFEEFETSAYVYSFLEKLAPDKLERMCGTGVKAVFGPAEGTAIAVRADMDALPVAEMTGLPFASETPGKMHACGHDGHMAIALTCASIVAEHRAQLTQPYTFIFQPAEETTGGAKPMIDAGVLENPKVSCIYGLHLWPYIQKGILGLHAGPLMASMSDINIVVNGRSCHGARPQDGADALVAACQFISSAQSIVARNVDPYEAAVVSFGRILGGEARNIVCDRVCMEGTVRVFNETTRTLVRERLHEILNGLDTMYKVHSESSETMSYPAVDNSPELCDAARRCFSSDEWTDPLPVMISEDFSFYQQKVPGLFAFLGTGTPDQCEPLHTARFAFDEEVLMTGVEFFLRVTGGPGIDS